MKKTLLLCFIHGFKGGDDTFGAKSEFAQHLAALLAAELPKVDVRAITYPTFETRGDLYECVSRFRDWLLEKVIDLEVANGTPSPTVDPSVHTILVGHSMGGIVAVETVISLAADRPVPGAANETGENTEDEADAADSDGAQTEEKKPPKLEELNSMIFPYIQGVLAFDTPFLGISPGVVAHGAEGHYNNAAAVFSQVSSLAGTFWGGSKAEQAQNGNKQPVGVLPAPEGVDIGKKDSNDKKAPQAGGWAGNWGKMAMYAGAGALVAAAGGAAYANREHITSGWSWVSSHLEFVGCLARGEELKARMRNMVRLNQELDIGFANLYTRLGKAAASKQVSMVGTVLGNQRTFSNLPAKQTAGFWKEAINDKATDEIGAHMAMFESNENPAYTDLSLDAKNLIVEWTRTEWYETSNFAEIEEDNASNLSQ